LKTSLSEEGVYAMAKPTKLGFLRTVSRHPLYVEHLILNKFKSLTRYRWAERHPEKDGDVGPPLGYKLVLTYKCNLRCIMCYEWGEVGWCHDEPKQAIAQELDWGIVRKLFSEMGRTHPYFILIGGEPLLYSRFRDLADLLKANRCFAITCTNGLTLDRFIDAVDGNPYLTFLISLDGLEAENDRLRGKGVYQKVTENISRLKSLKRPPYIGVEFTIRPENVAVMHDFCKRMASFGVDWILLNPCWFVSEEQAREYEKFMMKHFNLMPKTHLGYLMPYELDKEKFIDQMNRINSEKWPIQISCYLQKPEDIHTYVDKPQVPPGNSFCYRQWSRMDITPEGEATPCILYPDLTIGSLHEKGVMEIWNSPAFAGFRQFRREEILPICAKCNGLYLHDAKRKFL
jgi:MoaA/NifB/PqqE/SkfB family radical SAM enzyme